MRTLEQVLLPGEHSASVVEHRGRELRVWRDTDGIVHVTCGLSQTDPLLVFAYHEGKYVYCNTVECNRGGGGDEVEHGINVLMEASRKINGLHVFRMPRAVYHHRITHGDEDTNWFRIHCGVSWFRGVEDNGHACANDGDELPAQQLHEFMPKEREVYASVTSAALCEAFENHAFRATGDEVAGELMSTYRMLLQNACKRRPRATDASSAAAAASFNANATE